MTGPPVRLAGYGIQVVQQRAQASPPGLGFCLNQKWRAPRVPAGTFIIAGSREARHRGYPAEFNRVIPRR